MTGRELRTVWVTLVVEVAGRLSFKVRALPWRRLPRLVAEVVVAKGWLPGTTATEEVAVEKKGAQRPTMAWHTVVTAL